ncbi:cathepsin W [Helicoverpa armigera]|uniref:cathepsin W n=1 Tax=Helicoverpa armigera TaxID=29058 RepID=UPI0030827715
MLLIAIFLLLLKEYNCHLILHGNTSFEVNRLCSKGVVNGGAVPTYYDWRDQKMVSPVKNQLGCKASWAFSTAACLESHLKIYLGAEEILSEQFLLDCDDTNTGCAYASLYQAYSQIVNVHSGVLREKDYFAYVHEPMECRWEGPNQAAPKGLSWEFERNRPKPVRVYDFHIVHNADEDDMIQLLYKKGPLSAEINLASMKNYKGGIDEPTEESCDPKTVNHSVLIVGYNVYKSKSGGRSVPYWIIKNSWGAGWGDNGYYYLVRGRNACGIGTTIGFGDVEENQ